jgi:hypothetical protein
MSDQLLTPEEAAGVLRKPVATLRQWRYLGRGPAYIRIEHAVRYRASDLDRFIAGNRVEPQDAA